MYDSIFLFFRDCIKLESVWILISLDLVPIQRRTCQVLIPTMPVWDQSPTWSTKRRLFCARSVRDSARPIIPEMMSLCTNMDLRGVCPNQNPPSVIRSRSARYRWIVILAYRTSMSLHLRYPGVRYWNQSLVQICVIYNDKINHGKDHLPWRSTIPNPKYMVTWPTVPRYLDLWFLHSTKIYYGAWKAAHPWGLRRHAILIKWTQSWGPSQPTVSLAGTPWFKT